MVLLVSGSNSMQAPIKAQANVYGFLLASITHDVGRLQNIFEENITFSKTVDGNLTVNITGKQEVIAYLGDLISDNHAGIPPNLQMRITSAVTGILTFTTTYGGVPWGATELTIMSNAYECATANAEDTGLIKSITQIWTTQSNANSP